MSHKVEFNTPYIIMPMFFVGMTDDNKIAVAWAEGTVLLDRLRSMPVLKRQEFYDKVIQQVAASLDKRIPRGIIIS